MSVFEAIMLVCFGLGWPISILKTLKTKKVTGKSPVFLIIVAIGYTSGLIHKYYISFDWVIYLYAINLIMILADLAFYFHYRKR